MKSEKCVTSESGISEFVTWTLSKSSANSGLILRSGPEYGFGDGFEFSFGTGSELGFGIDLMVIFGTGLGWFCSMLPRSFFSRF